MISAPSRMLIPIGYMAAIYVLSSIPANSADEPEALTWAMFQWIAPQWQNFLHVPLYAGLATAWIWALKVYQLRQHSLLTIAFLLTAVWGLLDEAHQATVPGRYGSISDMLLNIGGAVLVVAYVRLRDTRRDFDDRSLKSEHTP